MFGNGYKSFMELQQKTEANIKIAERLDEVRRAIEGNVNNNLKQQAIDTEIKGLINNLIESKNLNAENYRMMQKQIQDLTKQKDTLSKANMFALKSNKTIERHSALMNQSQYLLGRMQKRELFAVGILEKARARMLNAKDAVTVSLIQNEVQTESRKYRKDLDMGQKTMAEKVTKQTEQQNTVANFYKNLSAQQKQEIAILLQKDTQIALVDGEKMTVKHTKKELTAEEEFNKSSEIENKEINKDRRKSKPLDNAQIREAQKAAESEKQQEQSKGYQK